MLGAADRSQLNKRAETQSSSLPSTPSLFTVPVTQREENEETSLCAEEGGLGAEAAT